MYSSTGVEPCALAHANHLTTAGESSVTPSPTAPKSVTKFFTMGSAMWNLLADRRIPASRAYTANDLSALCQIFRRPSSAVATSQEGHRQQRSGPEVRRQRWGLERQDLERQEMRRARYRIQI